jgi:hypothetical protein
VERQPVVSSNVASIGYNAETYVLEVEFSNGHIYQYFDVPQNVYTEIMSAASIGSYLNSYVRREYRYTRI